MNKALNVARGEHHCDFVDRLPKELRSLVHEYGLSVVLDFYNNGITKPGAIRFLIRSVRLGAREPGNRRHYGTHLPNLDEFLVSSGSSLTAEQIVRVIREGGYTVLPVAGPTREMTHASMATVSSGSVAVGKEQKHMMRLQAAMTAGDRALWGDL